MKQAGSATNNFLNHFKEDAITTTITSLVEAYFN
jgi:hypothetical protein